MAPNRRQAITWPILTRLINAYMRHSERRVKVKVFYTKHTFLQSNETSNNMIYIDMLFSKLSQITGIRGCSWRYQGFRRSFKLTWAYWRHMATHIWVNFGSGNGLLPDGVKPIYLNQCGLIIHKARWIRLRTTTQAIIESSITRTNSKITGLELYSNLAAANVLNTLVRLPRYLWNIEDWVGVRPLNVVESPSGKIFGKPYPA